MEQFKIGIEKYRARFGNINFPITQDRKPYEFEDFPLGRWANGYRSAFKDGSIKDWEKDQLNSIPGWIWDELEFKWNEGFEALNTYVAREGTAQVPQTHMEGSYPLGSWVARQRRIKKGAAQGSFTKEQLSKLESLPNWTWDASNSRSLNKRNEKWEIYFKALQKYVKTHKTSKIPSDYVISGLALGRWVSYQKSAKAGKIKGAKINPDEIKRLEDLPGWSW
jgi:hypothetical protein